MSLVAFTGLCQAATTTFDFVGDCSDPAESNCTGQVTATLTLQNYTQGDPLDLTNFVHFTYHSSSISIDGSFIDIFDGVLPAGLPAPAETLIENELGVGPFELRTFTDGEFQLSADVNNSGTNGVWSIAPVTGVPEPGSLISISAGFLALAAFRLRRRMAERATSIT